MPPRPPQLRRVRPCAGLLLAVPGAVAGHAQHHPGQDHQPDRAALQIRVRGDISRLSTAAIQTFYKTRQLRANAESRIDIQSSRSLLLNAATSVLSLCQPKSPKICRNIF